MNNTLLLLIGKSGSGKSTIQNRLVEKYGLKPLLSYTTRKERVDDKINPTHIFISEEDYWQLPNKVATTYFDGANYCATLEQVKSSDVYVVDYNGYKELCKNLDIAKEKEIILVYVHTKLLNRIDRMHERGDKKEDIENRFRNDSAKFNFSPLDVADDVVCNEREGDVEYICDYLYSKYFA